MPDSVILKALGLNVSPNPIGLADGSLVDATNIILKRDNVIESRRGFKLIGNGLSDTSTTVKQLLSYKNLLIRHFDNILEYDDTGNFTFTPFAGNYLEQVPGLRLKSISANNNFYFTTADGVKKLSAKSTQDFITNNHTVLPSGAVKAVDLQGTLLVKNGDENSFFTQDSAVAYRVVWGYTDANNNLILGTPSQRTVVYNPLINLLLRDFSTVLGSIDDLSNRSGSLIKTSSPNYFVSNYNLPNNSTASQLSIQLPIVAAALDNSITYADTTGSAPYTIQSITINNATSTTSTTTTNIATVLFDATQDPTQTFGPGGEDPNIYLNGFNLLNSSFTLTGVAGSQFDTPSNTIELTSHGLSLNQPVSFAPGSGGSVPSGVSTGTTYYIVNPTTNTFQISTQLSGASVSFGTVGTYPTAINASSSGTINGGQVITQAFYNTSGSTIYPYGTGGLAVPNNTGYITFTTTAYGGVNVAGGTIVSNKYRIITAPTQITDAGTDDELLALQTYLGSMISDLKGEVPTVISTMLLNEYVNVLELTTTATVQLEITVPQGVNTNYFFQIYRSLVTQALNTQVLETDVVPDDELALVYEGFVTQAEINAGEITIVDITPDSFRGAYLYTNASTGQGILQSNDQPPFASDINYYKNVAFFANTRTKFNQNINLLGVSNILTDIANNIVPKLTISNGTITNTYTFVESENQVTSVTTNAGSTLATTGAASYFTINSANNVTKYYVWYNLGSVTDPAVSGATGIPVVVLSGDTSAQIASKTNYTLERYIYDFSTSVSSNTITITNVNDGSSTNATAGTSGFAVTTTTEGVSEGANTVIVSNNPSPAQAVDETSRSLIRVVNKNANESVNLYYTSSQQSVPGQMNVEERTLSTSPFYILASDKNVGSSFSPDFSPTNTITSITAASTTVVTTANPHGLTNLDYVVISDSNSTPSIDGLHQITYISPTTFSLAISVSVAGTSGALIPAVDALYAQNQIKPNRLYYSKLLQPEAVPIVNYIDVGASDKAILRIFPLRDSLFIFKEDGLFRLSGDVAPFSVALFDSSCILIAPDSVDISNNLIYGWTKQGISTTTESGVSVISRPIDTLILPLVKNSNFNTLTWGIGYESDNSYLAFTCTNINDVRATIAYRYCNLTNSWTTYNKTNTCGIINPADDKLYMGAGDTNFIEQERKDFQRTDYADREFSDNIKSNGYFGNTIQLSSVSNYDVGDVFYQTQNLGLYDYNSLLSKLDLDPQVGWINANNITFSGNTVTVTTASPHGFSSGNNVLIQNSNTIPYIDGNYSVNVIDSTNFSFIYPTILFSGGTLAKVKFSYFNNLKAVAGDDLRSDLVKLAAHLDVDPNLMIKTYSSSIAHKTGSITNNTAANPTVITSNGHGLVTGRTVVIATSNSSPLINGQFSVSVLNNNTFSIPMSVITPGTTGTFNTNDEDFADILTCYNLIITTLNTDAGTGFKNYSQVNQNTNLESVITAVNYVTNQLTLDNVLDYIIGPITVYKSFNRTYTYSPNILGDPTVYKHFREATILFLSKAFTAATMSFSSDLLPAFEDVPFVGDGSGLFGNDSFGNNFFGGTSNSAPFRTYIPRDFQRCRYLNIKFSHDTAREMFSIYGITIMGDTLPNSRAYR